jgi:hypothetical protein
MLDKRKSELAPSGGEFGFLMQNIEYVNRFMASAI